MGGLDTKGFSARDVIYIVILVLSVAGSHFAMDDRVGDLEKSDKDQNEDIASLQIADKALAGLPADVKKMQLDIAKNAKTTTAIYYGLLANGTIEPPR